jgi:23S rRNA pseudouridine1911/1915/1917 synthase
MGFLATGSISFGCDLVAGNRRVPCPATGTIALRITVPGYSGIVQWIAGPDAAGQRLDHHLQSRLPAFSRSRLQEWIREGRVMVNGRKCKASALLKGGESIDVSPADLPPLHAEAEEIPLDILYEDESVIAVNKPAGMVVHAGAGVHSGTLVNALLHRFGTLSQAGGELRPGIVHRIDKDTSGVIVVARTDAAHRHLAHQFQSRTVRKLYLAVVHGVLRTDSGVITTPITRDPVRRTRMTCATGAGRAAHTEWKVLRRFQRHTYVEVRIATGRTHQIRVHMASIGHPILNDRLYGAPPVPSLPSRFFLHAFRLQFVSPATNTNVTVTAPLPADLAAMIESEPL